jgi:5-methylcytosine-specific restriction enzyme A
MCVITNCGKEAKIVDHILPIKQGGDTWNPNNHQALCKSCHAKKTGSDNEFNGIPRY